MKFTAALKPLTMVVLMLPTFEAIAFLMLQHREQFVVRHKQLLSDQVLVIATVYTLVALPLVTVTVRVLAPAVGVMLPPLATFFPP